jgi:hypothetical protein
MYIKMSSIPQQQLFNLEYYPSDFFYSTNQQDLPDTAGCEMLEYKNPACSSADADPTTLKQCYQIELCRNQTLVQKMFSRRNKHGAASAKYDDFRAKYGFEVAKSTNLLVGIIASFLYIYYNRNHIIE